MLLSGYHIDIRQAAACKPGYQPYYAVARLHDDIGAVIPYLNSAFEGIGFIKDPPAMMLQYKDARQIAVNAREILISDIRDRQEVEDILSWLKDEINRIWENRDTITPRYETPRKPTVLEVLKKLPKTNCGKCGQPTCTVFAVKVISGSGNLADCPEIERD